MTAADPRAAAKRAAGERAAALVEEGMRLGLGTGSTVYWTIKKLGERVRQGLRVQAIPTSEATRELASQEGITLASFEELPRLDLTIDGADEVAPTLNLIKGGGGALLREKLVAAASDRLVIVADESKLVDKLGDFGLPVEVVVFAWQVTRRRLENLGCSAVRREQQGQPFVTDNGNYILDCDFGLIEEPEQLHQELKALPGVIETGLFTGLAEAVAVGTAGGARWLAGGKQYE